MCSVLMSIKPEYARMIFSGKKNYEFRKTAFKRHVERIYIYSTSPVKRIVGEAEIESILIESPARMWRMTSSGAGISKCFFDSYYESKEFAVAYKLVNVKEYENAKLLSDIGVKIAPQSYLYVE